MLWALFDPMPHLAVSMGVCPVGQGHWLATLEDGNKGMDQRNKNLGFRRDVTHNHQALPHILAAGSKGVGSSCLLFMAQPYCCRVRTGAFQTLHPSPEKSKGHIAL